MMSMEKTINDLHQNKNIVICFLIMFVISSCTTTGQTINAEASLTPIENTATAATKTYTPEPSATITPTLAPTPMGGTTLRVAYLSYDCEAVNTKSCIAIADFFNESVLYRIPLNDGTTETKLSWSPNGRYLIYQDINEYQVNVDVKLYDFVLTQSTVLLSSPIELPPTQSYKDGELVLGRYVGSNGFAKATWSEDSKCVAYRTGLDNINDRIYIYSLESAENISLKGFTGSYYWLDDNKSLIEIQTGQLYNAETQELITIPDEHFKNMNVNTYSNSYIVSYKGENAAKTGEIYFYPYVMDRETLIEYGTEVIYDGEFLFAKFDYENQSRLPKILLTSLFFQGNSVIFSGNAFLFEPFEIHSYDYSGKMSDVPFMLTLDDFPDTEYDSSKMISISPDEKLYLTQQTFFITSSTRQSFITVNDMETGEVLDTFDFHSLGEEMHEIDYTEEKNLAFYWELEK